MLPPRRPKEPKAAKPPRARKVRRVCLPHRDWVKREFGCAGCGCLPTEDNPIDPAHYRIGTLGGTSLKPSDRWILPLCHKCHIEQHNKGERTFWLGRNPRAMCEALARKSPHWPILRDMP